jgi:transcription initiation factor TFIIIB Brf1 subunit/transcription initiation factor TFIIB
MVKVKVSAYCKQCGRKEITEAERDVDGSLSGDIHCRQCGNIMGDLTAIQPIGKESDHD